MTRAEVMRIAAEAQCDPRTVQRFVEKRGTKPLVAERIRAAMKKLRIKAG